MILPILMSMGIECTVVRNRDDLRDLLSRCPASRADRPIGEILRDAHLISDQQLARALQQQRTQRHRHLGRILVDSGLIEAGHINEALACKFGIPCVRLDELEIAPEVLEAIPEEVAVRHRLLPLAEVDGNLVVAMENPFDSTVNELLRFNAIGPVIPVQASAHQIALAHSRYHAESGAGSKPVVRLLDAILAQGILRGASDINIRPGHDKVAVWYRIDGTLQHARTTPRALLPALVSRIKIVGAMNIAERRLPQEGQASLIHDGRRVDLRISVIPTVAGESVVIRILDRSAGLKPLGELGLPDTALARTRAIIHRPHGMFLVTGPTGSGKSTTLYAVINEIRAADVHILTVEDPVEYDMEGIEQVRIADRIGLGFAEVLRRFLRHDPDVIMVGEIRDQETAAIACQAALTGHFVLSTLHTNDAPGTVTRLIDMGVEPCILAATLLGVMAQRLVRLNCTACLAADSSVDAATIEAGGIRLSADALRRGQGCPACNGTGYAGRAVVSEVLAVTPEIARLIAANAPVDDIERLACAAGMTRLFDHALNLVADGRTTVEEALRLRASI